MYLSSLLGLSVILWYLQFSITSNLMFYTMYFSPSRLGGMRVTHVLNPKLRAIQHEQCRNSQLYVFCTQWLRKSRTKFIDILVRTDKILQEASETKEQAGARLTGYLGKEPSRFV